MSSGSRAPGNPGAPVVMSDGQPLVCAPQHRNAILWAAILASSMGFIDSSVTAIAVPAMRTSLAASLDAAQWFSGAYLLALSSLLLAGGAMGDRFGVARVFLLGIIVFVLASLTCALAQTAGQMVAARAFQGVGAAVMVPGSMAIIARAFPREDRGRALGIWAAAATATTAMGPVLGGAILTWGGENAWRAIFALNLPAGLVAGWLLRRHMYPDSGQPGTPIDHAGAGLAAVGLGLVSYALISGGRESTVIGMLGAVVLMIFLAWEARVRHPMIRLGLFRNRQFAAANLATFLLYFALTSVMFYLPMTVISAWNLNEIEVTAAFLPVSVLIAVLSGPAGKWADKIGPGPLMAGGAALVALAYAAVSLTFSDADFWGRTIPCMVVAGIGLGLMVAPLTVAVMAAAGDAEQGAASGINNAVARVASLVAIAVMGTIATWSYGAGMPGFGLSDNGTAHVVASQKAFATIAAIAAICSALSAVVSIVGLRPKATDPHRVPKQ